MLYDCNRELCDNDIIVFVYKDRCHYVLFHYIYILNSL